MNDSTPHPQDEEFAQFSAEIPAMNDRKLIMTILGMLTMDGSPHPNRWRVAMNTEVTARAEGKRCPEAVRQGEEMAKLTKHLVGWKTSSLMKELGDSL